MEISSAEDRPMNQPAGLLSPQVKDQLHASSKQRHRRRILIVYICSHRLDALMTGPEDPVPQPGLLAVVVAPAPPLPMMQVVVLDDDLRAQRLQQPAQRRRHGQVQTQAAVAEDLGEGDVLVADPPLAEAHGEAREAQGEVGHERDADHVEELLLVVGVGGEERVRVLGEVVGAVESPQEGDVVHRPVVPVEPEVEDDAVEADFEREPGPAHLRGGLVARVGEVDGEDDARAGGLVQRGDDLADADVWHAVPLVLVAVEEAVRVAETAQDLDLVEHGGVEGEEVEVEDGEGA